MEGAFTSYPLARSEVAGRISGHVSLQGAQEHQEVARHG